MNLIQNQPTRSAESFKSKTKNLLSLRMRTDQPGSLTEFFMAELLEVEMVSKSFKGLLAVKNLSFNLSEGEILGLIGPNGAGKTLHFNLIAGVYSPDTGNVRFSGRDCREKSPMSFRSEESPGHLGS